MGKWNFAKYLLDAKKCVDSVLYISKNGMAVRNINLRNKVAELQRSFYINCCVVLDDSFHTGKKELCKKDKIVSRIYYERDKNSAHKDLNYQPQQFKTLAELADIMKTQIIHVREVCKDTLPQVVTLDFVPHGRELFRLVNRLTDNEEEKIKKLKHLGYGQKLPEGVPTMELHICYDTEEVRQLSEEERKKQAVVFMAGLNSYEDLQNQQDSCILVNVLHNQNMWCTPNEKSFAMVEELQKAGFMDQYEIPQISFKRMNSCIALKR